MYIWQQSGWPRFVWDERQLSDLLAKVSYSQGRLIGKMEALGFNLRNEAQLLTLTEDIVKTNLIEGQSLASAEVRSSVARQLGLQIDNAVQTDRYVEGVVEMMLDATGNYTKALSEKRLYAWHGALFPTGRSGLREIRVARLRDDKLGPMQVISGPIGREKVHFQAPPAEQLKTELKRFIEWFEQDQTMNPLLKAGMAHLWFISLHPFDDGNGRIARALTDMTLARSENIEQRFYSLSAQIQLESKAYYKILERSQKGGLDITEWQRWFLACLYRAIESAEIKLAMILKKARFWKMLANKPVSARQVKVLNRVLDGFEGKLTTSKWAKIGKCSVDTAQRDISNLIHRGALVKDPAGGRSTSYSLVYADR